MIQRRDLRGNNELRRTLVTYNVFSQADASVLFELGNTKVLCAITLQDGVPLFLRRKGIGWLNAEYAMLPTATTIRTQRESSNAQRAGRSVEISRLIVRVLRTVVNCALLGERTIHIDCDVLQADGGTRVAAITAASLALRRAQEMWLSKKIISGTIISDDVAAVAVGITKYDIIVDPDYDEDSTISADFNFVVTRSGCMIEIHGGAEQQPIEWELFDKARVLALQTTKILFDLFGSEPEKKHLAMQKDAAPLFSLQNRLSYQQK
jgi:ribonuclease PH